VTSGNCDDGGGYVNGSLISGLSGLQILQPGCEDDGRYMLFKCESKDGGWHAIFVYDFKRRRNKA